MEKLNQSIISSRNMKEYKYKASSWESCCDHEGGDVDLLAAGFSWPPRSYTCSFCKREFRSAQALGGHMNVHRRDRARLRQFSPPTNLGDFNTTTFNNNPNNNGKFPLLNLNLDPNPNFNKNPCYSSPNFYPSSVPSKIPHLPSTLSPLFTTTTTTSTNTITICPLANGEIKKWGKDHTAPIHNFGINTSLMKMKASKGVFEVENFVHDPKGCEVPKKAEYVRLELEIGLISHESQEELDLELRLG